MASTEQTVKTAAHTLLEMEDRRQSMSQQKPVPTERDTDPVGINSGKEGEAENKLPRKYLTGWKLWLLTTGYVSLSTSLRQARQKPIASV
jgi:hypothetical protein